MDILLKGPTDGIEAAERIKRESDVPVIYLTAHSDESTLKRAKISEPFAYLVKPYRLPEVKAAIEVALFAADLKRDRKRAEDAVREREKLLQDVVDNIGSIVFIRDDEGRFLLVNREFERVFNVTRVAAARKEPMEIFDANDTFWDRDDEGLLRDEPVREHDEIAGPGGLHVYTVHRFPLSDRHGSRYGTCTTCTDVAGLPTRAHTDLSA
jgi:PAS domain S-box-containing protein